MKVINANTMTALLFPLAFLLISIKYFRDMDNRILKTVAGLFILSLIIPYGWSVLKTLDQSIWISHRLRSIVSSTTIISAAALTIYYLINQTRPQAYKFLAIAGVAIVAIPLLTILTNLEGAFPIVSYAMIIPLATFAYFSFSKRFQKYEEVAVLSLFGIMALLAVVTQVFSLVDMHPA